MNKERNNTGGVTLSGITVENTSVIEEQSVPKMRLKFPSTPPLILLCIILHLNHLITRPLSSTFLTKVFSCEDRVKIVLVFRYEHFGKCPPERTA